MDVVVADGIPEIRSALRLLVSEEPGMRVAGEAHDAVSLLETTRSLGPAVVLFDWELADPRPAGARNGSLVREITAASPGARVIVMSGRPEARNHALAAGADAFVCKGDSPDCLLAALRATTIGRD